MHISFKLNEIKLNKSVVAMPSPKLSATSSSWVKSGDGRPVAPGILCVFTSRRGFVTSFKACADYYSIFTWVFSVTPAMTPTSRARGLSLSVDHIFGRLLDPPPAPRRQPPAPPLIIIDGSMKFPILSHPAFFFFPAFFFLALVSFNFFFKRY